MVAQVWVKLKNLYMRIETTYPANFVKTTDMVQQIQQFKLKSSVFQVNKHLIVHE